MWIEIRKKPDINGNCKRLYLNVNEYGQAEEISNINIMSAGRAHIEFEVTPRHFAEWDQLRKHKEAKEG